MAKNILLFHSSPRAEGNSHTLAELFTAGAEAAGHHVDRVDLGKLMMKPCTACEYCRRNDGICIHEDEMQPLYAAIKGADCIAMASPLYFYAIPAQLKVIFDRLYAFGPDYADVRGKESVLMMTAADTDPHAFDSAVRMYELAALGFLRWQDRGRLLVGGVNGIGAIKDNPALTEAYKLGYDL